MKRIIFISFTLAIIFLSCQNPNDSTDGIGVKITVNDPSGKALSDVGLHFYMDMHSDGYLLNKISKISDIDVQYFGYLKTDSSIVIEWNTMFEEDNMGFVLYRSHNEEDSILIASFTTDTSLISRGNSINGDYYFYEDKVNFGEYSYYLFYQDTSGNIIFLDSLTTVVEIFIPVPSKYQLYQNYPNPFNPATTIRFSLPKPGFVSLKITDRLDESTITTLIDKELPPGHHSISWIGLTDDSSYVTNNIYNYVLEADDFKSTKQLFVNMQDPEHIRSLNSAPLAKSNSNGIIEINTKYFPVNLEVIQTDAQGNELGILKIPEGLYLIFLKDGYQSYTKKVKVNASNLADMDVILYPLP